MKVDDFVPFKDIVDFNISNLDTKNLFLEYNLEATIACAKLYKKEYFAEVRYPFGKFHEDEYVTYKLLFQNERIAFVNEQLYFYFVNTDSIMSSKWSPKKLDAIEALRQQYDYFKNKNDKELLDFVVKKYIWVLRTQYDNLAGYDGYSDKFKTIKLIRRELKKCLKHQGINMPFDKNKHLYAIAYPKLINIFILKKE